MLSSYQMVHYWSAMTKLVLCTAYSTAPGVEMHRMQYGAGRCRLATPYCSEQEVSWCWWPWADVVYAVQLVLPVVYAVQPVLPVEPVVYEVQPAQPVMRHQTSSHKLGGFKTCVVVGLAVYAYVDMPAAQSGGGCPAS
jgi:hypothetical protein